MPPSPPLLLWPTMDIPKKLTVSILSVTVMMLRDIVESVMDEYDDVLDTGARTRRLRTALLLPPARLTLSENEFKLEQTQQ